jgi:hypothetical protein
MRARRLDRIAEETVERSRHALSRRPTVNRSYVAQPRIHGSLQPAGRKASGEEEGFDGDRKAAAITSDKGLAGLCQCRCLLLCYRS